MSEIVTFDMIVDDIGMSLENGIRSKTLSNVPPPNALSTIKAKGSSHTLIDTATMLGSIEHTTEINQDNIIITAGILQDDEIAKIACYNEYGTFHIPERSFIRSTFDEIFDSQIMEKFADDVQRYTETKLGK